MVDSGMKGRKFSRIFPVHRSMFIVMSANALTVFSPDNLLAQASTAPEHLGYRIVQFCVDERGLLATHLTESTATFYYSPSGGTLRDASMNIVLYSARFDKYKGLGKV